MQAVDFKRRLSNLRPNDVSTACQTSLDLERLREQLESDRGRIINSAGIRRLQQKTQVFPLERNAAVRSRLTHSLEVQQNGRFIVRTLFRLLGDRAYQYGLEDTQDIFETLVEMACLSHDVGNPPFGHFGEQVICQWFSEQLPALFADDGCMTASAPLAQQMLQDLQHFEGNAQAIRLVVHLQRLNLTYCQSAGLLKYVRAAYAPAPEKGRADSYRAKKPGFYLSEERFVQELYQALEMQPGSRHPVAYIMEAADDIAYCLADLEDAVVKGFFSLELLEQWLLSTFGQFCDVNAELDGGRSFAQCVKSAQAQAELERINPVGAFFIELRVRLVHPLVQHAARQFIEHIEAIYHGQLDRALLEDGSPAHAIVRTFKQIGAEQVYCHREVETLHLQGHRILRGVLDFYAPLLVLDPEQFQAVALRSSGSSAHLRMLAGRLPRHLLQAYHSALEEHAPASETYGLWARYYRCRLLQDFVSGMTDQQAQDEYRALAAL